MAWEASTMAQVDGVGAVSPTFIHDGWHTSWSQAHLPVAGKREPVPLPLFLFHIDGPPYGLKDERPQVSGRKSYRARGIGCGRMNEGCARRKVVHGPTIPPSSAPTKSYPVCPLRTPTEIDCLIMWVLPRLHDVTTPVFMLQAREDDRTCPCNSSIVYNAIFSRDKLLLVLDACYHVITVDNQRGIVAEHLMTFFKFQSEKNISRQHMQIRT